MTYEDRNIPLETDPRYGSDVRALLDAAFDDGDPQTIASALGLVARAGGMGRIAESAGLGRESLYKSLSENGNPHLATVIKAMRALGYRLALADATTSDQS